MKTSATIVLAEIKNLGPIGLPELLMFGLSALLLCGLIAAFVLYLLTLQKALKECHPDSQEMAPWVIWLNLIPIVSNVTVFITTILLANSLKNEFVRRGLKVDQGFGRGLGIATGVSALLCVVPILLPVFLVF
jgi:hypothetical protein